MIRLRIAITGHAIRRARERFAYLTSVTRGSLLRILTCAARYGAVTGEHVLVDQRFLRCRLPDGQALVVVVADRDRGGQPVRVVISVLRMGQLPGCGTWRPRNDDPVSVNARRCWCLKNVAGLAALHAATNQSVSAQVSPWRRMRR